MKARKKKQMRTKDMIEKGWKKIYVKWRGRKTEGKKIH